MTVTENYTPYRYYPAADMLPEALPWSFETSDDIVVVDVNYDPLVEGLDYEISGDGPSKSGVIQTLRVFDVDDRITILRNTARRQQLQLPANKAIPSRQYETELDRRARIEQEQAAETADVVSRALLMPKGISGATAPDDRADKLIGFGTDKLFKYFSYPSLAHILAPLLAPLLSFIKKGDPGPAGLTFTNLADFKAQPVTNISASLVLGGRSGSFIFDGSNLSASVTSDPDQGVYIAPDSDPTGASGAWVRKYSGGVEPEFFGAVGDGVADDSAALQAAFDFVSTRFNRTIYFRNQYYIADTTINVEYVSLVGFGREVKVTVKSGSTGVNWLGRFGDLYNIRFESEGTKTDGLGTNGIFWSDGSTGYSNISNVFFRGFSGFGIQITNAISFSISNSFFTSCDVGLSLVELGASHGTTTFLDNVYVASCRIGVDARLLYRSRFNVIGEYCDIAVNMFACDITLDRCYFEGNYNYGVKAVNSSVVDLETFIAGGNNSVDISYTGAVGVADRGYYKRTRGRATARGFALLSPGGGTPVELRSTSTGASALNTGLKYGEAAVALLRGPNILAPAAWQSVTGTEFKGFNAAEGGYEISTGAFGISGMKQTVTLDNTKQYIIDYANRVVLGGDAINLQVGGVTVENGVPFTPAVNGSNEVRSYRNYPLGGAELYVEAFSLSEVLVDPTATAKTQDLLSRKPREREKIYMSAPPVSGTWNLGEVVYNDLSVTQDFEKWIVTVAGSPGTWKGCGAIEA